MHDFSAERTLRELAIELPPPPAPIARYAPAVLSGDLLFVSGQGPRASDGSWCVGKVGDRIDVDQAYQHARLAGLHLLSVVRATVGSLDQVTRVVKLTGFVNCTATFADHPRVIDGCSDLFERVFGEAGRHARSAVGVNSLPMNISVEIEAIFKVR